jgi:hypothetical protein
MMTGHSKTMLGRAQISLNIRADTQRQGEEQTTETKGLRTGWAKPPWSALRGVRPRAAEEA